MVVAGGAVTGAGGVGEAMNVDTMFMLLVLAERPVVELPMAAGAKTSAKPHFDYKCNKSHLVNIIL